MKSIYKESTTLKELYAKTHKTRTVAISYLENSRTDLFHLIANTYTNFERLEWLEKEYKREIYIMGILTDPEKRKKFENKKTELKKWDFTREWKSITLNNVSNTQDFINGILSNEQYNLIYNEYLRTKDLLYLHNIFSECPINQDVNGQKRYLFNLVDDEIISGNLIYFTKALMNDLILKEIDNLKEHSTKKDELSLKQKALLIYFLNKYGMIMLSKIHGDITKQTYVMSALTGDFIPSKNARNIKLYKYMTNLEKERCITLPNLQKIKEIAENIGSTEMLLEINTKINKLETIENQ